MAKMADTQDMNTERNIWNMAVRQTQAGRSVFVQLFLFGPKGETAAMRFVDWSRDIGGKNHMGFI